MRRDRPELSDDHVREALCQKEEQYIKLAKGYPAIFHTFTDRDCNQRQSAQSARDDRRARLRSRGRRAPRYEDDEDVIYFLINFLSRTFCL